MKPEKMHTGIKKDTKETLWVDWLQQKVKLQQNPLKELIYWCSLLKCDIFHLVENMQQKEMVSLLSYMNYVVSTYVEELDNNNR